MPITSELLGVAWAPQQPERAEWVPAGLRGLVPTAEAAPGASGSTVRLHASSSVNTAGRAGVVPPGETSTAQSPPAAVAAIVAPPLGAGASSTTWLTPLLRGTLYASLLALSVGHTTTASRTPASLTPAQPSPRIAVAVPGRAALATVLITWTARGSGPAISTR